MSHSLLLSQSNPNLVLLNVSLQKDMTDAKYRAYEAVNQSYIKRVHTHGVAHAERDKVSRDHKTKALVIGSLYHCLTLEPNEVESRYSVAPNADRRTKQGKDIHEEFEANAGGRAVIKSDDWDVAKAMSESAYEIIKGRFERASVAREIAFTGRAKVYYKWNGDDRFHDFSIKGKLDLLTRVQKGKGELEILDLKSMASLSDNDVIASARGSCWGIQSAFYSDCINEVFKCFPKFTYVCSEKEEPNLSREFVVSSEMIERGRHNYLRALVEVAEWHKNGRPADYAYVGVTELNA